MVIVNHLYDDPDNKSEADERFNDFTILDKVEIKVDGT